MRTVSQKNCQNPATFRLVVRHSANLNEEELRQIFKSEKVRVEQRDVFFQSTIEAFSAFFQYKDIDYNKGKLLISFSRVKYIL